MAVKLTKGITLYFSRHGQTKANVELRFSGAKPTPLTPLGRKQAHDIGTILLRKLGPKPDIAFVCSPLRRARITMEIIRHELGLPKTGYAIDPRLREIDLGAWDGLTHDEAKTLDPKLFKKRHKDKWHVRVPGGGENYADVAARAESWLADLRMETFAVSHGAFTRILRGLFAGLDADEMSNLDEPQGCVFRARGSKVKRFDVK